MIKPLIFANSLAAVVMIFRLLAIVMALTLPQFFEFSIRSVSLGLIRNYDNPSLRDIIISILIPGAAAWILAYFWAQLYNKWDSSYNLPKAVKPKKRAKK